MGSGLSLVRRLSISSISYWSQVMVLQVFSFELRVIWWLRGNKVIILSNVLTIWLCYFMIQFSPTVNFASVISLGWNLGPHLDLVTCDLVPTVHSACWPTVTFLK